MNFRSVHMCAKQRYLSTVEIQLVFGAEKIRFKVRPFMVARLPIFPFYLFWTSRRRSSLPCLFGKLPYASGRTLT